MRDTLRATGLKTKREAVDLALRTLLRLNKQAGIQRCGCSPFAAASL